MHAVLILKHRPLLRKSTWSARFVARCQSCWSLDVNFGPVRLRQVHGYLDECIGFMTNEKAKYLLAKLDEYGLNRREKLLLLNLAPTRAIEVHLVRSA